MATSFMLFGLLNVVLTICWPVTHPDRTFDVQDAIAAVAGAILAVGGLWAWCWRTAVGF